MVEILGFKSDALRRRVMLHAIHPKDGLISHLMILLHGSMNPEASEELFLDLPNELELEELCDKFHMMIVIPLMNNRYYISTVDYDCDEFVAYELPDYIKKRYHLSNAADMVLAGISMGGFGAALIAARTGVYQKILSISGAFIAKDVEIGNPEVWGRSTPFSSNIENTFLYYFLPLSDLEKSIDRNALAAIQLFKERKENPEFVITCGTKDWLYERNIDFLKALDDSNIKYVFDSIDGGGHEANCFKTGLWNAMKRILQK